MGIEAMLRERRVNHSTQKQCPVDYAIDTILTLCGPSCNAAFDDFDACLAVRCRCNQNFCALCLSTQSSFDACHAHVLTCNPSRDYFMPASEWRRYQHTRCASLLWNYLLRIGVETHSLAYTVGIGVRIHCIRPGCLFPVAFANPRGRIVVGAWCRVDWWLWGVKVLMLAWSAWYILLIVAS